MIIDYTKIFQNPCELADFCLLDVKEQDAIIKHFVDEQKDIGLEYSCNITSSS